MNADEIRGGFNREKMTWHGAPLYLGSFGARDVILIEIAALLAEIRDELRKLAEEDK